MDRRGLQLSDATLLSCPHASTCGGCPLIALPYGEQLERKQARVARSAARFPALASLDVGEVLPPDPRAGYRVRAKVMVGPGGEVGIFAAEGDHDVVDTPGCIVLAPALVRVLEVLRPMIAADARVGHEGPLTPRRTPSGGGLLALDLRELRPPSSAPGSAPRVLVTWVVARGASFRLEALREAAARLRAAVPEVLGVAVNLHEGDGPQVLGKETMVLVGERSGEDEHGASVHRATFGSFVQAHRGQAARLHERIVRAVLGAGRPAGAPAPRVLDLYGGSGSIALALAARGADVVMVESFAPAVEQAQASARAAGVKLGVERADVADALSRLVRRAGRFDAAVVNPPRRGLDPVVRARLAELPLATVVYVSCQPETLARDLDHLARLGLAASGLTPLDMIPLTDEVETVAVLVRAAAPPPTVLYEDAEVLVVDKPPHEPTTPQGEHAGSLLARVQRLPGAARAVPVHRLDVGTSGVVIFAREVSRASGWAKALAADGASKTYIAAVRGVPEERGAIDLPIVTEGVARGATTRFERTGLLGAHALVRVAPEEGRTHQIRKHLAAIGHPVLGDARYGQAATNRFFVEKHGLDRTFLHAARLELRHPTTGQRLVVEAPLPGDLASVIDSVLAAGGRRAVGAR